MPLQRKSTLERYWSKVQRSSDPDGCWTWTGAKDADGYGIFWDGSYQENGRGHYVRVTRWTHEQFIGPLPAGQLVCHTCDNPPCVRPEHLFLGSHKLNHEDRERKGRGGQWMTRGERHVNHKLTEADVRAIRARYARGGVTMLQLARKAGVSDALIYKIVKRKIWAHVE